MAGQLAPELCSPMIGGAPHLICYHYMVEGSMRVKAGNEPVLELKSGDLVLFPRNDLHYMGSDISLPPVKANDIIQPPQSCGLYTIRYGGGGSVAKVICGFLGCEDGRTNPIISTLPAAMRLSVEEAGAAEWIRSTFQFAADELAAGHPGSETVLAKLSELLFVEAVRRYAESLPEDQTGWLAGLRDPYVAKTLALLHGDIAKEWTVEELSAAIGLSRSALADRFTRLIGVPPKQYLANWRMQVAAQKLRNSNQSLSQIAGEVGYDSDAAFSRAFKKHYGKAPAAWRKESMES